MLAQQGRLTKMETLHNFVLGKGTTFGLTAIGPLLYLRGKLHDSRLENFNDVEDARRVKIICKDMLDELILEWTNKSEAALHVTSSLTPISKCSPQGVMVV